MPAYLYTHFVHTCQDRLVEALNDYPDTCAVLVRRHGVYVWGNTWQKAKTMYVVYNCDCLQ